MLLLMAALWCFSGLEAPSASDTFDALFEELRSASREAVAGVCCRCMFGVRCTVSSVRCKVSGVSCSVFVFHVDDILVFPKGLI